MLRRSLCIAVTLFGVGLAWSSGIARADEEEPVIVPNAVYSERNSYHPRYGETDGAPAYVLAPNARIIHVDDGK
jgi:hypothetical protein